MNNIFELVVIIICGLAAAVFLGWYFFSSSRRQKCKGCAFYELKSKNKKTGDKL